MDIIKKFQNSDKYTKSSIIIIILFSLIVLSLASVYHVSGDGCWHIPVGKFIANNHKFPLFEPLGRDEPFWSPPLYHILVAAVYYIFNLFNHEIANFSVKFISPIFGILSLIFSFLVIKKTTNSKIAFYSTIFLAFIPIFIDYSVLSYVESMLVFFVVLSIYFLINDKIIFAGIAAGLSILTKYNGVFILPVLICILYKKFNNRKKLFYKKLIILIFISLLIPSPWFIRNWILLGNPIWPFLNFVFSGYQVKSYSALNLNNLVDYNLPSFTYFGIFGVPDGNYNLLSILNIKYLNIILPVWLFGTFLFLIPLFIGFFRKKKDYKGNKSVLSIWVLTYLILFFLYAANVGFGVSRIILPALPALAVFWAFGFEKLSSNENLEKIFKILIVLIAIGFILASFAKTFFAANEWNFYQKDFYWVKSNTNPDSVFIANGQCVPYNIERASVYYGEDNLKKADYIWTNQNFWLDRRSILDESSLNSIKSKNEIAYSNKETGTTIYKITH